MSRKKQKVPLLRILYVVDEETFKKMPKKKRVRFLDRLVGLYAVVNKLSENIEGNSK